MNENSNMKFEFSIDDLQKLFGLIVTDSAKASEEERKRNELLMEKERNNYNLLMEKYEHRKKIDSIITIGLITIILAIIIAVTVIFSSMTLVIENGESTQYGTVTLHDSSKLNSDNSSVTADTYNNYVKQ